MSLQTLAPPGRAAVPPRPAGVHLTGVTHRVFTERAKPVFGMRPELARLMVETFGAAADQEDFLARTGNGFIEMTEALLEDAGTPLPPLDAVVLAYHSPDLYHSEVAGCYLAGRLPGNPEPCSVAGPGPGAAFTALRLLDGMCRLGEATSAALLVYDQNAVLWDSGHPATHRPDAAVLLQAGATGDVAVTELEEVRLGGTGPRSATLALADVLYRHPGVRVLAGAGLAKRLAGTPYAGRVEAVPDLWCTGVWAGLARVWPLEEPVLLADFEPASGTFCSCLLVPGREH